MKARVKFTKRGSLIFLSHLDVMRYFQKAIRRCEIPIAFTEGYSAHMVMSFASPLAVGISSMGEYFDIGLRELISSKKAVKELNQTMAEGIEVLSFRQIPKERKMMGTALLSAADYLAVPDKEKLSANIEEEIKDFLSLSEIPFVKATKRSQKMTDIRSLIYQMQERDGQLFLRLAAGGAANLRPDLAVKAFCQFAGIPFEKMNFRFCRLEMYARVKQNGTEDFVPLEDFGKEID